MGEVLQIKNIHKKKKLIRRTPNKILTKEQQYIQNFMVWKVGKENWDFETGTLIKRENYEVAITYKEIQDSYKGNLKWETITNGLKPISTYGYLEGNNKKGIIFNVFSFIMWDKEKAMFNVGFNNYFIESLLEVKKDFIKLDLNTINSFTSKYTLPVYEFLKSYTSSSGHINKNISVEEMREITLTKELYKITNAWRVRVLEKVITDLKNSDLNIRTKIRKSGRGGKIIGMTFTSTDQLELFTSKEEEGGWADWLTQT